MIPKELNGAYIRDRLRVAISCLEDIMEIDDTGDTTGNLHRSYLQLVSELARLLSQEQ